jgi:5-methylcytosine-specific restriction endonuclease McrA
MRTLVLNAGYEPMQLISWERAICLVLSQKAEMVAAYDRVVRSVSAAFPLPSVVRLKTYVRVVRRYTFVKCTRKNILLRDRSQCQYCGTLCKTGKITIDHIIPRCRGGKTQWENVVAACRTCNHHKGNLTLEQSGLTLSRKPKRPVWHDLLLDHEGITVDAWSPYFHYVA